MARAKPVEKVHQSYGSHFDAMCVTAGRFWPRCVLPSGEEVIFVDLLMQDVRVALRNLTLANGIRRMHPARIVALVGPDPDWRDTIWQYYDTDQLSKMATAWGAVDVIDVGQMIADTLQGVNTFEVAGHTITLPETTDIPQQEYDDIVAATAVRIMRVPEVDEQVASEPTYKRLVERSKHYARIYDALFSQIPTAAFVTSHIDYAQWGLAVEAGMRLDVPVIHVQSTGSLKAYALFPDQIEGEGTYRMQMTRLIAEYFEECVWKHRDALRRSAELSTWRSKVNLGRPSWWRGGGSVSQLEFRTRAERDSVRTFAARRFGWDPAKPIITVFDHAVSDAVRSNKEIFDNLGHWFRETVEFAAENPNVNWLFVDHPAQAFYDSTQMFEKLAEKYGHLDHMVFTPSMDLSKNVIWSLVDYAVTVRGSVSNEYPAYGIPALQAGWSEWSHCGISRRADTQEEYWQYLREAMDGLNRGDRMITEEQIERARLWLVYYRALSDVASPLVPHWESSQAARLYMGVNLAMSHIEADGDNVLIATRRMWDRHEPFLTRAELHAPTEELPAILGLVSDLEESH